MLDRKLNFANGIKVMCFNKPVAAISEWCDDQTRSVAQILVAVLKLGGDLCDNHVILRRPIVAQLRLPIKIERI
jgi:hypothetical protein